MNSPKYHTLSEIALSIERMFDQAWSRSILVSAEMNSLNFHHSSGHCYPELVEKQNGRIVAQMRGIIWKDKFQNINRLFNLNLGEPLRNGMKILMEVKVRFSAVYGLSLEILNIDPTFTLGDLEKERQENLKKLQSLGVIGLNQQLPIAALPKRLAIISFESSKGYSDFISTLSEKGKRFGIDMQLFNAAMQGEQAPGQIRQQLKNIAKSKLSFDAVVIIRGGGDEAGMSCFNDFELCLAICQCKIPVFTGIGHSTNLTISEQVSHTSAITPSALAEWIVSRFTEQESSLNQLYNHVHRTSRILLFAAKNALQTQITSICSSAQREVQSQKQTLQFYPVLLGQVFRSVRQLNLQVIQNQKAIQGNSAKRLVKDSNLDIKLVHRQQQHLIKSNINQANHQLQLIVIRNDSNNPERLLEKGYSLTFLNGKIISDKTKLSIGDSIETHSQAVKLVSTITQITSKS
jgi:exodeoxyribonuclease VII large subunit